MTYTCHNRAPFKQIMRVNDKKGQLCIPFRMAKECQYTLTELGKADKECEGCKWRANADKG